ncbi:hypothetical protein [Dyadobacter sp. 676]|uniref:Phage head morphogenesis domain-containing protein n=1 Tax=Dyadobacter sp. 676 TaxID=3088362 RepID=A0AAU8FSY5_9BACT
MTREQQWAQQLRRSEGYARIVDGLFQAAIKEAIRLVLSGKYDPDKPFQFKDFPGLTQRVRNLFAKLAKDLQTTISTGIEREWQHANAANDELVDQVLKTFTVPRQIMQTYRNRNLQALAAFQQRKVAGMNLSKRVWNLTKQFQGELEMAIDLGLGEGLNAQQLSQSVRAYLNEPDKLFRRVRDKRGQLQLSKAARNYHPGKGVYRSSYKNAMRLTRTEINMAYRDSDYQRWQSLDFVVGFEVKRSNNKVECDLCDSFIGKYPKTYKFIGNHPHCRCVCVPILASRAEIEAFLDSSNTDEPQPLKSKYEVDRMPKGWTDWIKGNTKRVNLMSNPPYFIKDNFKGGRIANGLKFM